MLLHHSIFIELIPNFIEYPTSILFFEFVGSSNKKQWSGLKYIQFNSVQFSRSVMSDSLQPHELQHPGLPVHHQLPEFTQSHVHWVGDDIQPFCSLLSPFPPAPIHPSIRVFSNESTLHMRWPKYWSFSSSISPSNEHPGLISFRMDWLDLLAVQATLKSLLQT